MKLTHLLLLSILLWVVFAMSYELFFGVLHPRPSPLRTRGEREYLVCAGAQGPYWCTFQEKWDTVTSSFWLIFIFLLPWIVFWEGGLEDPRAIFEVLILTPYIAIPLYWLLLWRLNLWWRNKKGRAT